MNKEEWCRYTAVNQTVICYKSTDPNPIVECPHCGSTDYWIDEEEVCRGAFGSAYCRVDVSCEKCNKKFQLYFDLVSIEWDEVADA